MGGVIPEFRRKGVLTKLMKYIKNWAKEKGYNKLTVKTWDKRRKILFYLIKHGFHFTKVEQHKDINKNKIFLEISI